MPLPAADYRIDGDRLTLPDLPDAFTLEVTSRIDPKANTSLMGLYLSNGDLLHPVRARGLPADHLVPGPAGRDVELPGADRGRPGGYPALLSNGNPLETGELPGGRHWALWEDPFPKPSYLFALVAGDLACLADESRHPLRPHGAAADLLRAANIEQCHHAMASLKKSMRWDEERYGSSTISTCSRSWRSTTSISAPWRTRASTSSTPRRRWPSATPRPTPTSSTSSGSSPTNISTTGPATGSPAATGSS